MELGFLGGLVVLIVIFWFRRVIWGYTESIERRVKISVLKDSIPVAKDLQKLNKELEELGDIPNLDDMLDRLNGKQ